VDLRCRRDLSRPSQFFRVCRDRDAAVCRFGVVQEEIGVCYPRTGRQFLNDGTLEREVFVRVQAAATKSGR